MNLTIVFKKPEIASDLDWQIVQEINILDGDKIIAKAEIELITLNKHRDAKASYALLDSEEGTDWEIPLNLFFKGQNLSNELCEKLNVVADTKKAKTHMMIEAFSVLPAYRKQGVARFLLNAIAEQYPKVQSLFVFSLPMQLFLDVEACDGEKNTAFYQALDLANATNTRETLQAFWQKVGFTPLTVDETLLEQALPYDIFVSSPAKLNK